MCKGLLLITLNTNTFDRTPLDEGSARGIYLWQHTSNTRDREPGPGRIWNHNPIKQPATNPRLKTRWHRDRHYKTTFIACFPPSQSYYTM